MDAQSIVIVFAVFGAILCFFMNYMVRIRLTDTVELQLSRLKTYLTEMAAVVIKIVTPIYSYAFIFILADDSKPHTIALVFLVAARITVFACWAGFCCHLAYPSMTKTIEETAPLSLLLEQSSLSPSVGMKRSAYHTLIVVSILEITFLRYLPWIRTEFTEFADGYPDLFMVRTCIYGHMASSVLQVVGSVLELFVQQSSEAVKATKIVLVVVSVLNLLFSFFSTVTAVNAQMGRKLVVVSRHDIEFIRQSQRRDVEDNNNSISNNNNNNEEEKKERENRRLSSRLDNVTSNPMLSETWDEKEGREEDL